MPVGTRATSGPSFAFVDTHTEAYDDASRDVQRDELLGSLTDGTETVVIVGDFNAVPGSMGMPAGFVDAWLAAGRPSEGPEAATCCQAGDLATRSRPLKERIDYVWVRGARVRLGHADRGEPGGPDARRAVALRPRRRGRRGRAASGGSRRGVGAPDRERLTARGRS